MAYPLRLESGDPLTLMYHNGQVTCPPRSESDDPLTLMYHNGQVTCPPRSESDDLRVPLSCVHCLDMVVGLFVYSVYERCACVWWCVFVSEQIL